MQLPETIKQLPEECLIISYDFEANQTPFIPGCTMSIGAFAIWWTRNLPPIVRDTFFWTMETKVPMTAESRSWWKNHPQALEWSLETHGHTSDMAFWQFLKWIENLDKGAGSARNFPIVLLAQPHDYDAQHIVSNFSSDYIQNSEVYRKIYPKLHLADCAELYATQHNLPPEEGKAEFKRRFMPKHLLHHPTFDSMAQLNATLTGLLHQRLAS